MIADGSVVFEESDERDAAVEGSEIADGKVDEGVIADGSLV